MYVTAYACTAYSCVRLVAELRAVLGRKEGKKEKEREKEKKR